MTGIRDVASNMTEAAQAFLEALDQMQLDRTTLPFGDEDERRSWFYTPTPRPGLYLREMNPEQRQGVNRMLASGLSVAGYNFTTIVMGLEPIVDRLQGFAPRGYGDLP